MKQAQKGFTLIELMIVIAIIGILAAIAIPQYQDYVTRSKISEGLSLVQSVETAIAETYQSNGTMPQPNNASFGLPQAASISGKYVDSIDVVATGTTVGSTYVTITYNKTAVGTTALAPGAQLSLTAITGAGSIAWVCGKKAVTINGASYSGSGTTNVPVKYLPSNCRA